MMILLPKAARDGQYWRKYLNTMRGDRVLFDSLYEEIRTYYAPYDPRFHSDPVPGEKRGQEIFDSDPIRALKVFTSTIYSQLLPLTQDYFSLTVDDDRLAERRSVKQWLLTAERAVYNAWARSNFRLGTYAAWRNAATYGTGALYVQYNDWGRFQFKARPLPEVYISENGDDEVDLVIRYFRFTARQIVGLWPNAQQSEKIQSALARNPEEKFVVFHVTAPREHEEMFNERHTYISCYYLEADLTPLNFYSGRCRGTYQNPWVVGRIDKDSTSPYGYSNAAIALADVKTANKLRELQLKALAKVVDPPILAKKKSILSRFRLGPGAMNYVDSDDPGKHIVPFESRARFDVGALESEALNQRIQNGFLVNDLTHPYRRRGPNITAREIDVSEQSAQRISVPEVSRLEYEFLGPLVLRTLDPLIRDGIIPEPPTEIREVTLSVRATGPLALNQQLNKVQAAERLLMWLQQNAGTPLGQEMARAVRGDRLIINMAEVTDIWPDAIRTPAEIEELQAMEQQKQQMAEQLQAAQMAADAYGKAGGAEGLGALSGALGGGGGLAA